MFHSFPLYITCTSYTIQYARVAIKINRDDASLLQQYTSRGILSDDDVLSIYMSRKRYYFCRAIKRRRIIMRLVKCGVRCDCLAFECVQTLYTLQHQRPWILSTRVRRTGDDGSSSYFWSYIIWRIQNPIPRSRINACKIRRVIGTSSPNIDAIPVSQLLFEILKKKTARTRVHCSRHVTHS